MFDLLNCLIKMFFTYFTFCITNPSQYSYLNDPNLSRGICLNKASSCLVLLTLTCALPKPWSLHIIYKKKVFRRKLRTASDSCKSEFSFSHTTANIVPNNPCTGIWGFLSPLKKSLVYILYKYYSFLNPLLRVQSRSFYLNIFIVPYNIIFVGIAYNAFCIIH